MENRGIQCSKTVLVRNVSFIAWIRRAVVGMETINVFFTTIHGLDHDLMQLLKMSERKMVMYNIASNFHGTLRRIGKATE